mmetsp:Transcript_33342/g.79059  ORF Transcript_33342/g.79059 Transcript_33342/m.79059 type:complete len:355 (+) Transcript_33342:217-1281(+)
MRMAFSSVAGPSRDVLKTLLPSVLPTKPEKLMTPLSIVAWPAIGVRQDPSSAMRKARSQTTASRVGSSLSLARYCAAASSPVRQAMPMAPWETAGSISSSERMLVMASVMSRRLRPASARRVASTVPSSSFLSRVCTFPRKFTTLRCGYLERIWHCRRSAALPTTAPSGSSDRDLYFRDTKTSRVSSRGRLQGRTVPSGRYVGTSFMECTAMSILPSSRASSISLVKSPLPPMSASGWLRILSPVVLIILISSAPSSLSSGKFFFRRSLVKYAWASASGLPRVPMVRVFLSVSATAATQSLCRRQTREELCCLRSDPHTFCETRAELILFFSDKQNRFRAELSSRLCTRKSQAS